MTLSLSRCGITLLASTIAVSSSAWAQLVPDQPSTRVVITAARLAQLQTDALPHTTVISAEDIRSSQASDLPALLEREAGIQITRSGGSGQQTTLFVRGANATETLIMIDGIPMRHQASFGGAPLQHILLDQIDRIEIVRGNVSAIYGSGAIGGVVQIFTKHGSGAATFDVAAEVGSRGTYQGNIGVSGQSGATRYALSLTRCTTEGFSAQNPAQNPNVNPNRNGDRNTSIAASLSQEWSKENDIGVRIYATNAKTSFDSGFGTSFDLNDNHAKDHVISVFSNNRLGEDWTSALTLSHTVTSDDFVTRAADGVSTSGFKSAAYLLQWFNTWQLSSDWTAIAGIDAGRDQADVDANSSFGSTQNSFSRTYSSAYVGINGKLNVHQLQLNLRRDDVGGSGADNTVYLGYGLPLTDTIKWIASASTAFNAPTPVQLFDPQYGNTVLQAEKSRSYEAGVQYTAGATWLRATLFDTLTRNQFGADTAFRTININRAKNQGLELSVSSRLAEVDVRASLTVQDAKNADTDQPLARRAKVLGSLFASKSFGVWRIGGDVQYTDRRPDIATQPGLAAYWLANVNARYQLTKKVSVYARIDNLFNRDYQTAYGYNQAARGVFSGIHWQL